MILEITTLGAGTFDVDCDDKDLDAFAGRLGNTEGKWLDCKQTPGRGGSPILLNTSNIVSIKAKR